MLAQEISYVSDNHLLLLLKTSNLNMNAERGRYTARVAMKAVFVVSCVFFCFFFQYYFVALCDLLHDEAF